MNDVAQRADNPLVVLKDQITRREPEFRAALPAHIPVERFSRVVMTAVQVNPELLECDRRSFFNAAMRSAQDGLLPDGREGAMVVRKDRKNNTKLVNWQPMIAGIRKKARNSGEIADWNAYVVHANDAFEYELGDEPFIRHRPALTDPGPIVAAYSICTLKNGEKSREVMSIAEIRSIRDRSDAWKAHKAGFIKSTPWSTDEGEMCRKTVARRHSKMIPMSSDLDDLVRRDDDLYDFKGAADDNAQPPTAKVTNLSDRLGALVRPSSVPADDLPPSDGPLIEHDAPAIDDDGRNISVPADGAPYHPHGETAGDGSSASPAVDRQDYPVSIAWEHGVAAKADGRQRRDIPQEYRDGSREHERRAWLAGFEGRSIPEAD